MAFAIFKCNCNLQTLTDIPVNDQATECERQNAKAEERDRKQRKLLDVGGNILEYYAVWLCVGGRKV